MHVLNRHGKCKQTAVELVGNVVSAGVEGSGRCVHPCACVGQMQDGDRRLQADHPRALRMGEASAETVSLDISSMFVRVLSELHYCCPCSGTHVFLSLSRRRQWHRGTNGIYGVSPFLTETMFCLTARIGCLCESVKSVGGIDVQTRYDRTWTAFHGGHAADS